MIIHGRREPGQGQDKSPSSRDVSEWTQEQETGNKACLHERRDDRSLFVDDMEILGKDVENWVVVVKVGY